jgi:polyphenol oxidase
MTIRTSPDWITPPSAAWPEHTAALTTLRQPRGGAGVSTGAYASLNLAEHVGDRREAVMANRAWLLNATGLGTVQWLQQVHGRHCVRATPRTALRVPVADAVWTTEPGLALAILSADCVPVVLTDTSGGAVGAAHGGWRGLTGGVLASLVAAMKVPPVRLRAWIGPAIGAQAYEVGEDVVRVIGNLAEGHRLLESCVQAGTRADKHQLDLYALTVALLERLGVEAVPGARFCTSADPRFYSYRRDGETGRMATLAWLRG